MAKVNLDKMRDNSYLIDTEKEPLAKRPKDQPRISRLTKGSVIKREKPLLARMFGETAKEVSGYVWWDVLIPSIKAVITDIVTNGIEMIVYGSESRGRASRGRFSRDRGKSHISYSSYYGESRPRSYRLEPETRRPAANRHSFDNIVLETRADAELVLEGLLDLIDLYGTATVADFYAAVGLTQDYNDRNYGWETLATATVERVRDGYILVVPKPVYIPD